MKIFVTGGTGFVGAETIRVALSRGHSVIAMTRPDSELKRLLPLRDKIEHITLDVANRDNLRRIVSEAKPDIVIHSAWFGVLNSFRFDRDQIDKNIAFSCDLAEFSADANVKAFIGIGSQAEYGPASTMLETALPNPTTLYGSAKVAAYYLTKQIASQSAMRHIWLRLFSTYGPDDNPGWLIPSLITELLNGRRPKTTQGLQTWDYLYVTDVAEAIMAAAEKEDASGLFNLGSGTSETIRAIVTKLRDLIDPSIELVFGEIPYRPDQVMTMQADITKLKSITGWAPRISLDEGLHKTVQSFRGAMLR